MFILEMYIVQELDPIAAQLSYGNYSTRINVTLWHQINFPQVQTNSILYRVRPAAYIYQSPN